MKGLLVICLMVFSTTVFAQHTLTVKVGNVSSAEGKVNVAVYNSKDGFLSFDKVLKNHGVSARKGSVDLTIKDLPTGEYALAIFHDENNNGKLDTNWLGIPKEKVAFSNAKMKTFGPPKYKECAFTVNSDYEIHIDF
ncbi:DUF2141 domain-containing protein [Allomuricauda sp. NBRC 101325]|uniref:DUF2141 domain-containing protein n=1 Tax=Allomuricauda sp. NBRC 101325 TaxID=1113758 RepID=UPI0024A000D9|nr:DUF2141 domain-containing protein [Muricauda sp. NBRC 101325]GLU43018.1 hypothetical protein Musp01_06420 [Muricauda sp. NBRC 101325]